EAAGVPPLPYARLPAAKETFLSRDAVSAFPLLYVPLPQPLPDVRCRGSAAREQLLWRFCVNPSPRRSCREGRPVLSPARSSQFLPLSAVSRDSCAYRAARPSERKIRAREYPARELKSPDRQPPHPAEEDSVFPPPRRSSKILSAPRSPAARAALIAPAQFPVHADRDPSPLTAPWSPAGNFQWCARRCQPWHPHTCLLPVCAASSELRPAEPACAERSKARCPVNPIPFRLPPLEGYGSVVPGTARDSRLPGKSAGPERLLRPSFALIPVALVELECAPARPPPLLGRNSSPAPKTSVWSGCERRPSRVFLRSFPTPSWDRCAPYRRFRWLRKTSSLSCAARPRNRPEFSCGPSRRLSLDSFPEALVPLKAARGLYSEEITLLLAPTALYSFLLFTTAYHFFPLCAPIVVRFENMSRGIRYGIKDFFRKQDRSWWLIATQPQLVVDTGEGSPQA